MKRYRKRFAFLFVLGMIVILSACSVEKQSGENNEANSTIQTSETVTVTRGTLTPTVSAQTTIIQASDFVLSSTEKGVFETCVTSGDKITAGGVIGKVSENEIKSPVDGTVISATNSSEIIPNNYPVATVRYTGFAIRFLKWTKGGFDVLKMIFKDLRISPLRNILTSISMLVGIIAMIGSFLVGTLGKDYLISVNAQMYGWTPTYSYSITDSDFQDSIKMEEFFYKIREIDDCVTITFDMRENIIFAPIVSVSSLQGAANDIYKKVVPVDVVLTTTAYNKIYNLPMSSGSWFSYSETEKSLCMVVNKEAESYFNTPYAVGNTGSSLSLTPFNVTGTVNDGKDIPTVYLDAQAVEEFLPNMWQVQNASVYWHLTKGLTTNQMYSSLDDILQDTIGGHIEYSGRSDIGDAYDSVLSMLQLGLLITSFLLLFVSVLGQINIGLSSLEQRTYELLIRRAIGASRINIVALVLGTQLVISIFVCIVSILLSILIVEGIGIFLPPDTPVASPAYPFFSAVVAVVASVTVALLGGLLPALKAAKLEPALALR